jgi:predicted ABC-type ATPase
MASFGDIKSVEAFKLEEIKKELTNLLNAELANWKTKNPGVAEEDLQCLKMLGGKEKFFENANKYIHDIFDIENGLLNGGEQPVAIVMVGAPSAGKSTAVKLVKNELSISPERISKLISVNSDSVIEAIYTVPPTLPELPFECRALSNKINDFTFKLAKRYEKDIIYDATGKDYYPHIEKITQLHSAGYKIVLCIVMIDRDVIVKRVQGRNRDIAASIARGEKNRDQTPIPIVTSTYDQILSVVKQYILLPKNIVSEIFVYDTSGDKMVNLIKRSDTGLYTCDNSTGKIDLWFNDINICKAPTEASAKAVIERPAIKEDVPPVKESAAMKIFKRPPIISSDDEGMTSNENSQASDYGGGRGRIMKTKTKGRKTLKHKKRKSHKNIKSKTRKHKMNKKGRSNKRR